jgi:hypothetical protein
MRRPEGLRATVGQSQEEQGGYGKKATVSSGAKSGSEKPWHRLRANQRHVRRSAGKAPPGGRAFTRVCKKGGELEKSQY